MDLKLKGLNVLVTGGSSGIGAAIVQEFLNEGCNVSFCSRSKEKIDTFLATVKNEHNAKITVSAFNVNDTIKFSEWIKQNPDIDIFIPNVSALSFEDTFKPNENTLSTNWDKVIEIDIVSIIKQIEIIVPYLEKSKYPAITYMGSLASHVATQSMPAYGAAKAAMSHYMKTLSKKLLPLNIRVNTISPGTIFVEGGFWDVMRDNRPDIFKSILASNPMNRLGTPDEVAKAVVFISSPIASFISGTDLIVDGNSSTYIQ